MTPTEKRILAAAKAWFKSEERSTKYWEAMGKPPVYPTLSAEDRELFLSCAADAAARKRGKK